MPRFRSWILRPRARRSVVSSFPKPQQLLPLLPALAGAVAVVVAQSTATVGAQSNPLALPRLSGGEFATLQVSTFSIPLSDGAGGLLSYGGGALGVSEDGNYLYYSCQLDDTGIAKLEIPPIGGMARVVAPCLGPTRAEIAKISPDPNAWRPALGGVLEQGGRITVAGYIVYDADGITSASHWGGPSLSQLSGPFAATVKPGLVKSSMAPVPPEWRAVLGGPAMASTGYTSIISRASYGAAISIFDPADVNRNGFPMSFLLGCPWAIPGTNVMLTQCVSRYGAPTSDFYNGSEQAAGVFIVPGTRTLVQIEREASGPTCYGYATRDQALHGTPYKDAVFCYSLSDTIDEKGPKGFPYRLVAKLYDLAELVEVKQGRKSPWDINQYATVDMPGSGPGELITGGAYNPVRGEYYLVRYNTGDGPGTIYVYKVGQGIGGTGTPTPYNFRANVNGSTVALTWDLPIGAAISNVVVEAGSTPGQSDLLAGAALGVTASAVAANVPSGTYYARVRAVGPAGVSAPSNEALVSVGGTLGGITPPGVPQGFYASADAGRNVSMVWHAPATGGAPTGYILEAGTAPGRIDIVSGYPLGQALSLYVPGVPPGTYYVRLRAVNAVGAGAPTNESVLVVR